MKVQGATSLRDIAPCTSDGTEGEKAPVARLSPAPILKGCTEQEIQPMALEIYLQLFPGKLPQTWCTEAGIAGQPKSQQQRPPAGASGSRFITKRKEMNDTRTTTDSDSGGVWVD